MDDLISRQAAIEALNGEVTVTGRANAEAVLGYANLVADRIKRLPSAHPEIIHCRECDYWIPGLINDNDGFIPPKCGKYQQMVGHSANDYCSYAERRTE